MAGKQHTFQNAGKCRNMNILYDIYSKTAAVGAIPHIETWQGASLCRRPLHRGQRTKNAEKTLEFGIFRFLDHFLPFRNGFGGREGFTNDPEPYGSILS